MSDVEQFQPFTRIISEEENRQRLVEEFDRKKSSLFSEDPAAVAQFEKLFIEYISEVLTYIDLGKIQTRTLKEELIKFLSGNDFQGACKETISPCLQIMADRMSGTDRLIDSESVNGWNERLMKSVKSPEFAPRVFEAWQLKSDTEILFEDISALYDGNKGQQCQSSPLKSFQRATNTGIVKDLAYTIAVFAKCTMSLSQKNLDKIMPDAIKAMRAHTPEAFSTESMTEFFKAVRDVLKKLKENIETSAIANQEPSVPEKDARFFRLGGVKKIIFSALGRAESAFFSESSLATDASMLNALQIQMLSEKKTIWHAVSAFSKEEGKSSWHLAKLIRAMTKKMKLDPPDWVAGKDRGVFGETPLHIALLWNKPETPGLTDFFDELWDMCEQSRTAQYTHPLYSGENVLHIAIVKKVDVAIIRRIVESKEWEILREHRADGSFFKNKTKSDGACNILGEHPLSFAACTNQRRVFRYMVGKGACLKITTSEGHNLLHLMVLNAFDGDSGGGATAGGGLTPPAGGPDGGCADGRADVVEMYKGMYDEIEACMGDHGVLDKMRKEANKDGFTPLQLAAAVGSLPMFNHLFDKEVEVAWIFGPVVCRKLYLKGIDVPLRRAGGAKAGHGGAAEREVEDEGDGRSVLEVLVDHERKDIIANSLIDKIVEAKWSKYGSAIFHIRLLWAVVFTGLMYLAPMANPAFLSSGCRLVHALGYLGACCWAAQGTVGQVSFRDAADALVNARFKVFLDIENLFCFLATPILAILTVNNLFKVWLPAAAGPCWCWSFPAAPNTNTTAGAPEECASGAPEQASLFRDVEKMMYALLSVLSFLRLLYLGMGFEEYGAFILMIVRITRKDLPVFMAIYTVFLLGVGHLHYFASNDLHAGVLQGMDSVWRIFSAGIASVRAGKASACEEGGGAWGTESRPSQAKRTHCGLSTAAVGCMVWGAALRSCQLECAGFELISALPS